MDVIIRDLLIEDIAGIYEAIIDMKINITLEQLVKNLTKRISCEEITILALINGEFCGIICATIDHKLIGGDVAFLEDLYILPKFRNKGVGTLLGKYIQKRVWDISSNNVHKNIGAIVQEKVYIWKHIKQGVL
jgi:GNAT superfamily N-acetyltransferase